MIELLIFICKADSKLYFKALKMTTSDEVKNDNNPEKLVVINAKESRKKTIR